MNDHSGSLDGAGKRVAILVSRYNSMITDRLLAGALEALARHGVADQDVDVFRAPGAWELSGLAARVAATRRYDALVALGCVIRGETPHFDFVAGEAARGLGMVARDAGLPLAFGVLTTDTLEQAEARAGKGAGNKGQEAALSVLEMINLYGQVE